MQFPKAEPLVEREATPRNNCTHESKTKFCVIYREAVKTPKALKAQPAVAYMCTLLWALPTPDSGALPPVPPQEATPLDTIWIGEILWNLEEQPFVQ